MGGLVCPECGHEKSYVADCRPFAAGFRRRREYQLCGHRWTTYECDSAIMRRRECLECGVRWNTFECMEHRDEALERQKNELIYAITDTKAAIQKAIKSLQEIQI